MEKKALRLQIELDDQTGQIRRIHDTKLDRTILEFNPGHEFELNGVPAPAEVIDHADEWGGLKTRFDVKCWEGYLTGARYEVTRTVVPGGEGNHIGNTQAIHFRHIIKRVPWGNYEKPLDDLWKNPIEAPDLLKSLTTLCAPTEFLGPNTHMRATAIGGSGPREHVSLEEGPVKDVVPWLQTSFRSTFPGQSSVPGALYYDPDTENWLWIVVRHADIGGEVVYREDGQRFRFLPYKDMKVHDRLLMPDISVHYGQGMAEADRCMAQFFDLYEEPPSWWYHTSWFWLHSFWQPNMSFDLAKEAVRILMDDCGVTGFGMTVHDLPPGGADCQCRSPKGSPLLGGDDSARELVDFIHARGGHCYVWMGRYGKLQQGGPMLWRDNWALRGMDERPVGKDEFRICDSLNPDYQAYLLKWVEYYVGYLGIDGIFWDSAFQPQPPNFSEASRGWLNFPGESMAGAPTLYEEVYRLGKSLHEDFFMWGEGISTERMTNAFAVDNRSHGEKSGHELVNRLAHAGPRRLVWRSAWSQDVSGAFPFVSPAQDIHQSPLSDFYKKLAADPMNQWLCRTVKERGCRQARGIADGIAVLDEFLVVPNREELLGTVSIPTELARGTKLVHELTGTVLEGRKTSSGVDFELTETGPWRME